MSCWTILEINPTKDLKEIKKAYSRLIECYNIEKDTNEYTILTNAYVKAMSLVNTSVKDMSKCLSNNSMDYTYENIKSYCDDSLDNKNYINAAHKQPECSASVLKVPRPNSKEHRDK